MFTRGQIVFSKSGRDKGLPFIIVSVDGEYLYLVDGDLRKLAKPKKKKCKHVQVTKSIVSHIQHKLETGLVGNEVILEAEIKKALLPYKVKE